MSLWTTLTATFNASLWFTWIAVLIAILPTMAAMIAADRHRLQYLIAGVSGSIAGEFCGVASLFLGLWFSCVGQGQTCNTAQGDMGLIITLPAGSLLGCLSALFWVWATLKVASDSPWAWVSRYSGTSRVRNWGYVLGIPAVFWVLSTIFLAWLMALSSSSG
jgi:hypothetical protein